ncbi:UNKNOWN [Stylonychia lemnae]|uniref:Uncharacterized protein n=1 Tax=Stylonychia lemnae TaxID=5949 RepID=A0A078B8Y2_STYLE|nr:UNKNOWN [Stylonychia lemnae]|eukprot:CDW90003.1 UNKNOWN [Stylonychia lemnae]
MGMQTQQQNNEEQHILVLQNQLNQDDKNDIPLANDLGPAMIPQTIDTVLIEEFDVNADIPLNNLVVQEQVLNIHHTDDPLEVIIEEQSQAFDETGVFLTLPNGGDQLAQSLQFTANDLNGSIVVQDQNNAELSRVMTEMYLKQLAEYLEIEENQGSSEDKSKDLKLLEDKYKAFKKQQSALTIKMFIYYLQEVFEEEDKR